MPIDLTDFSNRLSQLLVNASSISSTYRDMFYSDVAQDITIQYYDVDGILQTTTVPNNAKNRQQNISSGAGSPEGSQVGTVGSFYVNTLNLDLFYKGSGVDNTGWIKTLTQVDLTAHEVDTMAHLGLFASINGDSTKTFDVATPTVNANAATKLYADGKLALTGGTLTGALNINSPITDNTAQTDTGNIVGFYQHNIKNTNSSVGASSDVIATADNGNDTTHYVDMGINSSGGGIAPFIGANEGYIYSATDSLNIGALGSNSKLNFYTNTSTTPAASISSSGILSADMWVVKGFTPQSVNLAKAVNGLADFITAGTGLKARILASATNLVGNGQYKDRLSKFQFTTDFDTTSETGPNRRSILFYKNWSSTPIFDYTCQRPQWGNTFDVSKNLLMDFSSSLTTDKYGNTVTVLGNPTLSGGKYVGDGTGDGLKVTTLTSLGKGMWCIEFYQSNNADGTLYTITQGENQFSIKLDKTVANKYALYLSSNGSSFDIANGTLSNSAFTGNTLRHIAIQFDGSYYRLYVDSVLETSVTSGALITNLGSLNFGINYNGTANSLNGTFDDIRATIGNVRYGIPASASIGSSDFIPPAVGTLIPDAYWYDTANKIMKYGSPANWTELPECVPLGEVVTNATAVVSAVSYALNGRAISPILTGANNTVLNFNDNLGHANKRVAVRSRFNSSYQWSYQSGVFSSPSTFGYSPTVKNDLVSSAELKTASGVVGNGDVIGYNSFPVGNQSTGEVQIIVERIDS